jgi:FKBP-type peptidyl-prolyl cis-trans isomerase
MKKLMSVVLIAVVILALVITYIYFNNRKPSRNNNMEPQLKTIILKAGTGEEAVNGTRVTVNYTGWLTNGTKFDSSLDRNRPLEFTLGNNEVIEG